MSREIAKSICPLALVFLGLFVGCAREKPTVAESTPAAVDAELDDASWTEALIEHRREIDESFRASSSSPMAGTQYLKSEAAERVYLTRRDGSFDLAYAEGPTAVLLVELIDGTWHWRVLGEDVVCEVGGEVVESGAELPGSAMFTITDLTVRFHPSEDKVTFIVFDSERPEMQSFDHLLYFPPDRSFAVPARIVKLPEPEAMEMPTSRGLIKTFYRYAKIQVEVKGEEEELTALKYALSGDESLGLFIPFKDTTTGYETYGAGRYLQIDDPVAQEFVLDFNRAFNPLCNYSPAFNCTLPPHENHLDVPIRAGELAYPH